MSDGVDFLRLWPRSERLSLCFGGALSARWSLSLKSRDDKATPPKARVWQTLSRKHPHTWIAGFCVYVRSLFGVQALQRSFGAWYPSPFIESLHMSSEARNLWPSETNAAKPILDSRRLAAACRWVREAGRTRASKSARESAGKACNSCGDLQFLTQHARCCRG